MLDNGGSGNQRPALRRTCVRVPRPLQRRRFGVLLGVCWPPLGKAAIQFAIWRRAVEVSAVHGGACPVLGELANELRRIRRAPAPAPCPVDITEAELAPFLAGFASAEAHFGASREGSPQFIINLRADDGPLLRLFRDVFEVGHLAEVAASGTSRAAVSWRVGRLRDLRRLVAILDMHRTRGRAADVYAAWRELVILEPRPAAARRALAAEVRGRRQYVPGLDAITRSSWDVRSRCRCADALTRWAESQDYPGSSGDYETWRRAAGREAPIRNTIAAAYGSWRGAPLANGLDTDRSLTEEQVAAIRAGNAPSIEARRAELRGVIVETLRRCIGDLGREPRATEFLRWRVAHAPGSPAAMTIYRLFPGGFAACWPPHATSARRNERWQPLSRVGPIAAGLRPGRSSPPPPAPATPGSPSLPLRRPPGRRPRPRRARSPRCGARFA